ncbi:MAG: hypothetical protein JWL72_2014 [Ilumatobacteraceae bacterium]|nr:hypothetical protein [Ilumatobacteraceae bacterium]MCU1388676.1 hypothetical protein [Ilumatobacteraceae bacterium]
MSITAHHSHNSVRRLASDHPGFVKAGRVGWFAKGVVYVVAGVLALLIASKASGWSSSTSGGQEASPTGALKAVAQSSGGPLLLVLLAIGMLLYAAWRLVSAALPGDTDVKGWIKRIGYVVSAVIYTSFAVTAIALAASEPSKAQPNGNSTVSKTSGGIMHHTGGRLLIGIAGLVVIGAGVYRIAKAFKRDVNDELNLSGMSSERRRATEWLGVVGEFGRGLGIGLIGYFLLRAALTYDANKATGLDGALRTLVTKSGGVLVVLAVGAGFVAYGLFCLTTFTHRRLEAP